MTVVTLGAQGIAKAERMLADIKNGAPRAITRALNETSNKAKTFGIEQMLLDVRLTKKYLSARLLSAKDTPANRATFNNQVSKVTADNRKGFRGVTLGRYVTNADRVGLGYPRLPPRTKVKPGGVSTQWMSGFLLPIGDETSIGLFVRGAEKIEHQYGPSPSQMWKSEKDVVAPAASKFLADNINKQVQAILRQSLAGQL